MVKVEIISNISLGEISALSNRSDQDMFVKNITWNLLDWRRETPEYLFLIVDDSIIVLKIIKSMNDCISLTQLVKYDLGKKPNNGEFLSDIERKIFMDVPTLAKLHVPHVELNFLLSNIHKALFKRLKNIGLNISMDDFTTSWKLVPNWVDDKYDTRVDNYIVVGSYVINLELSPNELAKINNIIANHICPFEINVGDTKNSKIGTKSQLIHGDKDDFLIETEITQRFVPELKNQTQDLQYLENQYDIWKKNLDEKSGLKTVFHKKYENDSDFNETGAIRFKALTYIFTIEELSKLDNQYDVECDNYEIEISKEIDQNNIISQKSTLALDYHKWYSNLNIMLKKGLSHESIKSIGKSENGTKFKYFTRYFASSPEVPVLSSDHNIVVRIRE